MERLNTRKTIFLGFGMLAVTVCASVYSAFVPVFLRGYLDKAWLIGFFITMDSYLSLFLQPVLGRLSDRTRTRLGRRMPYIVAGMPLAAVFFCLIPNHRSLPALLVLILLYNLSLALFRSPVVSLMPDITPAPLRSRANGIVNLLGGLGAVAAFLAGSALYGRNPAFPFYLGGFVLILGMTVLLLFIREGRDSIYLTGRACSDPPGVAAGIRRRKAAGPRAFFPSLRGMGSVLFLLTGVFFLYVAFNAVAPFFTLYCRDYLNADVSRAAVAMAFFAASMVVFAVPAGLLGSRLGKKRALVLGLGLLILVFGAVSFLRRLDLIGWFFIAGGFGWALVIVNAYPFVVSMTATKNSGAYTGLYYLFTSLAAVTSPPLIGALIDRLGYGVLFLYVTAAFILALLAVLLVRVPDKGAGPRC